MRIEFLYKQSNNDFKYEDGLSKKSGFQLYAKFQKKVACSGKPLKIIALGPDILVRTEQLYFFAFKHNVLASGKSHKTSLRRKI